MQEKITFIHAADLHLDSPFQGLNHIDASLFAEIRNSTFTAFDQLVTSAIEKQVDFVLLVGDLFDNEKQTLKAQIHLRTAFEKLKAHHIAVYLSYGNHDFIKGNIHPIEYPDNVHIFNSEEIHSFTFEKAGQALAEIYGFSYENRAVMQNKAAMYKINNAHVPFHIAMLHGSVHGNEAHDPYAPFHLSEVTAKPFDYWALGHIHKREVLHQYPPVIYPGNIQGRHRKETGEKGCYYVSMSRHGVETTFIPLQSILFASVTVDVSQCDTITALEQLLIETIQQQEARTLLSLTLYSETVELMQFEQDGLITQLIDILNEQEQRQSDWVYMYRYQIQIKKQEEQTYGSFFLGEVMERLASLPVEETVKDLYQHQKAKQWLEALDEDEVKRSVAQLLAYELNH